MWILSVRVREKFCTCPDRCVVSVILQARSSISRHAKLPVRSP